MCELALIYLFLQFWSLEVALVFIAASIFMLLLGYFVLSEISLDFLAEAFDLVFWTDISYYILVILIGLACLQPSSFSIPNEENDSEMLSPETEKIINGKTDKVVNDYTPEITKEDTRSLKAVQGHEWQTEASVNITYSFKNHFVLEETIFHYPQTPANDPPGIEVISGMYGFAAFNKDDSNYYQLLITDNYDTSPWQAVIWFSIKISAQTTGTLYHESLFRSPKYDNGTTKSEYSVSYDDSDSVSTDHIDADGKITFIARMTFTGSTNDIWIHHWLWDAANSEWDALGNTMDSDGTHGDWTSFYWAFDEVRFVQDDITSHIRSEFRQTDSPDLTEWRCLIPNHEYQSEIVAELPDYVNTSSIQVNPSCTTSLSSNQLTLSDTIPTIGSAYEIRATYKSQKRYLATEEVHDEGFEGTSGTSYNSTVVFEGSFSDRLTTGSVDFTDSDLPEDFYYGFVAVYIESAPTSIDFQYYTSSWQTADSANVSLTNCWQGIFCELEPSSSTSSNTIRLNITGTGVVFVDGFKFYREAISETTSAYQEIQFDFTLNNWFEHGLIAAADVKVNITVWDRTASSKVSDIKNSTKLRIVSNDSSSLTQKEYETRIEAADKTSTSWNTTASYFTPIAPGDFPYYYEGSPEDNEWDFTEGFIEECSRQGGVTTTDTIENGYWKMEPDSGGTNVNYYIGSSTWTVDTSVYTRLIMRIKGSEALRFVIWDSGWNMLVSYTTISTSYQEFSLDLSADSDWTGNDQVRIQFVETSGGGNFEGTETFYIDHLRLIHRDSPSLTTESSYAFTTSCNNSLTYRVELDGSLQGYANDLEAISLDQTDATHTVNATPYRDNGRNLVFLPGTSLTASYVPVAFAILSEDFVIGDYVAQYAITTSKDNDSTAVAITLYLNDTEVTFPDGSTSTTPGVIVFSRPSYGYYNFTRQAIWGSQSLTKSWNITVTSNAEVTHLVVSISSNYYTCDWGTNKGTGSLNIYDNDSLIQTDSTEGLTYQQKSTTEGIHLLEFNVTVESRVFSYTANYTVTAWTVTVYLSADQRVAIEDQVTLTVSTVRSDGGDFYGTVVVNGTSITITADSGTTTVTNANVGNYSYTVQSVVDNTDRSRSFTASNTWIRYDKLFAKLDLLSAETLLPGQAATIYVNMTYMYDDTEVTNTYTYDVYINNQYWQSFDSKRQVTIPFEKEGTYSIELRDVKDIDYYITEYKSQIVQVTVQEPSEDTDFLGGLTDPSVLGLLTLFGIAGLAIVIKRYSKNSNTQQLDKVVTGYDDKLAKKQKGNIMDSDWNNRKKGGNLGRRR